MLAENTELRYPRRPDRVIPPGSILYLAEPVNSFLGELSDDAPITAIAKTDLDSDRRNAQIELVGEGWKRIGATDAQMINIRALFRSLLFNAREIDTVGKLREACRNNEIAKILGLGEMAQAFLAVSTKKHPQALQNGAAVKGDLVQSSL